MAFSPFPKMFSKAPFFKAVKTRNSIDEESWEKNPEKRKYCGKMRKWWWRLLFSFPRMFSALSKTSQVMWSAFISVVQNCFNEHKALTQYHKKPHSDTQKIYSCGKHCEKRRNCFSHNVFYPAFNSLPNDKIFDWSKFKAFPDDKINVG